MLSALQRREELVAVLFKRRFDTASNLAAEFKVSKNTIYRDIGVITLSHPIWMSRGIKGGIYVMDGAMYARKYLNAKQEALLIKLMSQLSGDELIEMQSIMKDFSLTKK